MDRHQFMSRRHQLFSIALRVFCLAGSLPLLCPAPQARADSSDISLLYIRKRQFYRQIDGSPPVRDTNPFVFVAGANPTGVNRITSVLITPPRRPPRAMNNVGGGTFLFDGGRFA